MKKSDLKNHVRPKCKKSPSINILQAIIDGNGDVLLSFDGNVSAADWMASDFEVIDSTFWGALSVSQENTNTLRFTPSPAWGSYGPGTQWRVIVEKRGYILPRVGLLA